MDVALGAQVTVALAALGEWLGWSLGGISQPKQVHGAAMRRQLKGTASPAPQGGAAIPGKSGTD